MYADSDLPAGWLTQFRRGVFAGAGLLLLAVAAGTLPAFLVWLVPGADTTPATSAVKAGALLTLSAAHGGIRLDGQSVTLTPLLVTALLAWLVAGQARRSDSWSAVAGLALGYGVGSGLLARWAELGSTRAPGLRSAAAGFLFVLIVGGLARATEAAWPRLSARYQQLARAAAGVLACYAGAGAVLVAGSLVWHLGDATALQRQVAPGVAGLPVALLGLAASPNAVLAAISYLTGPGFTVGRHTSVSAVSVRHGALPDFPLLAAVPQHATTLAGVLVIALVAGLAGWLALRLVAAGSPPARLLDALAATVLAGGVLAVATALAAGGIGTGALASTGASWWATGGSVIGLVGVSAAGWSVVAIVRGEPVLESMAEEIPARRLRSVPTEQDGTGSGAVGKAGPGSAEAAEPGQDPAGRGATVKPSRHVS